MRISAVIAVALSLAAGAAAAETRSLGAFGSWQAYSDQDGEGKLCYATAAAVRSQGGERGRKPIYLAVTHRSRGIDEVSLIGHGIFRAGADPEIQIGGMQQAFFVKGGSAWARMPAADRAIVAAMRKGGDVVVRAGQGRDAILDTISLKGFPHALAAIDESCEVKR